MKSIKRISALIATILLYSIIFNANSQTVKIMPLGNSITYDDNVADKTNPRPAGDRISYRYKLYQLITAAGYEFDFVGSENSGNNYFQNTELDDNAGFPGITDSQLDYLINTGYNQRTGSYETSGPYLNYYPTDIILLHIGTNDVHETSEYVEDLLDDIRSYDSDVIIFVARIIDRVPNDATTHTFNDNVEAMISARGDNKIVMVDMEDGAGIDYTISVDMSDYLHPNQNGYEKMAIKWWEAINNFNQAPVISSIPEQTAAEGTDFDELTLDDYVIDTEDPDYLLEWTITEQSGTNLTCSLDVNRVLHVSPVSSTWVGSETVKLKVKDTGNGAFYKEDSFEIVFTTIDVDNPPEIYGQTEIPTLIKNNSFEITKAYLNYTDIDTEDSDVSLEVFSGTNYTFSGNTITPVEDYIGYLAVNLKLKDQTSYSDNYEFEINVVKDPNNPPVINSTPSTNADDYESYSYTLSASDIDTADEIYYFAKKVPSWASFSSQNHQLVGTPRWYDANNTFDVTLGVTDGRDTILQDYAIYVTDKNDPPYFISEPDTIARVNNVYIYELEGSDNDENDELSFSLITGPEWLSLTEYGDVVTGTPPDTDSGKEYPVSISLTDGNKITLQLFYLQVLEASSLMLLSPKDISVYPNPAVNNISFDFAGKITVEKIVIINQLGQIEKTIDSKKTNNHFSVDISKLSPGIYYLVAEGTDDIYAGKFIVE